MSENSGIDTGEFFGAVLKAVACTRNHHPEVDAETYASGVLEPTKRIRALEQDLGERPLTQADAEQVLTWLESTFRTKRTPDEERAHYLGQIARRSGYTLAAAGAAA